MIGSVRPSLGTAAEDGKSVHGGLDGWVSDFITVRAGGKDSRHLTAYGRANGFTFFLCVDIVMST